MRLQLRYLLPYSPLTGTAMVLRYEKISVRDLDERVAELRSKGCALFSTHPEGLRNVGVWTDVEIDVEAIPA